MVPRQLALCVLQRHVNGSVYLSLPVYESLSFTKSIDHLYLKWIASVFPVCFPLTFVDRYFSNIHKI